MLVNDRFGSPVDKHTKQDQLELRESVAHASGAGRTSRSHYRSIVVVLESSFVAEEMRVFRKLEPTAVGSK